MIRVLALAAICLPAPVPSVGVLEADKLHYISHNIGQI